MIYESSRYYSYDGTIGRCALTGNTCDNSLVKFGCRNCLVLNYMWWLENKVRE